MQENQIMVNATLPQLKAEVEIKVTDPALPKPPTSSPEGRSVPDLTIGRLIGGNARAIAADGGEIATWPLVENAKTGTPGETAITNGALSLMVPEAVATHRGLFALKLHDAAGQQMLVACLRSDADHNGKVIAEVKAAVGTRKFLPGSPWCCEIKLLL